MNAYFRYCIVTWICALLCAPVAQAQDEDEEGPWSGKVALGYLATTGNTENSSLNTSVEIGYGTGDWQHSFKAFAINASENNVTTAEAYELGWKSERNLTEHDFLFGRINWREDKFSGYRTQLSETIGYGRRLIDVNAHKLNAEIGLGARQSDLSTGTTEEEFIVRGGLNYKWIISESAEFNQEFVVESGDKNTYLESVTALKADLVGSLALVASYTIKNNSDVPIGTQKTDTYSALSIEYTF
jgi:putative salt-induced outer membrane protein